MLMPPEHKINNYNLDSRTDWDELLVYIQFISYDVSAGTQPVWLTF